VRLKDIIDDLSMLGITTKASITAIHFDTRRKSKRILLKFDRDTKGWCIFQEDKNAPISGETIILNV
jgi:hypothetical protein